MAGATLETEEGSGLSEHSHCDEWCAFSGLIAPWKSGNIFSVPAMYFPSTESGSPDNDIEMRIPPVHAVETILLADPC